ncbi:unnamed protein product [Moneuplotes crassus]|uniref:Uncharacterized protein n=1 Tax=Euplotes crassus TaxID=5936 RepID=A0AAD1UIW7_EUPCR|nr:unnamed protein product [Moneuplotes crassus]
MKILKEKLHKKLEDTQSCYLSARESIIKEKEEKLGELKKISDEIYSEKEGFLAVSHRFEKRIKLMNNQLENTYNNTAMYLKQLKNYESSEQIESKIFGVLFKSQIDAKNPPLKKHFKDPEDLTKISDLNSQMKSDLNCKPNKLKPKQKKLEIMPQISVPKMEEDRKREEQLNSILAKMEKSKQQKPGDDAEDEPIVIDEEIRLDKSIVQPDWGKNVHQRLEEIKASPYIEEDVEEEDEYKITDFEFIQLPADGFIHPIEVCIDKNEIINNNVQSDVESQKKIVKKSSLRTQPQKRRSSIKIRQTPIPKAQNTVESLHNRSVIISTPKTLPDLKIKPGDPTRSNYYTKKSYSRMRESTKMVDIKEFIRKRLL